jgi:SAM-dependent methyltransferase
MAERRAMALEPQTHEHLLAHHRDFKAFAQTMIETHAGRFDPVFWAFVGKHAPENVGRIVDLGTGPGLLLKDLADRYPNAAIIGVDGQPEMLSLAEKNAAGDDRLSVMAHDLGGEGRMAIDDASVDLAIASVVVHELQVPTRMLDEAARILRPGGTLVIYDWVRQSLESYAGGERPTTLDQFTHFSEHCRYTPDDLAWLISTSGFEVTEHMARKNGRFLLLAATRSP